MSDIAIELFTQERKDYIFAADSHEHGSYEIKTKYMVKKESVQREIFNSCNQREQDQFNFFLILF